MEIEVTAKIVPKISGDENRICISCAEIDCECGEDCVTCECCSQCAECEEPCECKDCEECDTWDLHYCECDSFVIEDVS